MDCLLILWPLLISCSLGNSCCTFGFLIFIIVERNFLYHRLYILTEKSLKHLRSIRAWLPVSIFLSLSLGLIVWSTEIRLGKPGSISLSLSLCYHRLWTTRSLCIKGPQQVAPQIRDSGTRAFWSEGLGTYWGQDLLRSVSTKTWVKQLESPIISLLYFTICLTLRDFWFRANE